MDNNKIRTGRLTLLLCFLLLLVFGVGSASFSFGLVPDNSQTESVSGQVDANGTTHVVTVKYEYILSGAGEEQFTYTLDYIATLTSVDSVNDFISKCLRTDSPEGTIAPGSISVTKTELFKFDNVYFYRYADNSQGQCNGKLSDGQIVNLADGRKYNLAIQANVETNDGGTCGGSTTTYKFSGTAVNVVSAGEDEIYLDEQKSSTINVPHGHLFDRSFFLAHGVMGLDDYLFSCFMRDDDGDGIGDAYYDESTPITQDLTLYALFYQTTGSSLNSLTKTVSNLPSGQKAIFNDEAAIGENLLSNDETYVSESRTVFLGSNYSATTIRSGATVSFGLNDGSEWAANVNGGNSSFIPNENQRQYTVVLQGDLIVEGTLFIGSEYGSSASSGVEGNINKRFVAFDLNGHTITVNKGGFLDSRGLIKDSKGTGAIIVHGGTVQTLVSVSDYRGGSNTSTCVLAGVFPFQLYQFAYLNCRLIMTYDSSYGWGKIQALVNIQASSSQVVEPVLNFIGTDGFLFGLKDGSSNSSYVIIEDIVPSITVGNVTASEKQYRLDHRSSIELFDVDVEMSNVRLELTVTVNTGDYNFPISPYFDIKLLSSNLTVSQQIKFLPGASFIADGSSSVIMSYDESADRVSAISVIDRAYSYFDQEANKYISTDNINVSGASNYVGVVLANSNFSRFFPGGRIEILGKLVFDLASDNYIPTYTLSGPVDFSRVYCKEKGSSVDQAVAVDYQDFESPFALIQNHFPGRIGFRTIDYDVLLGMDYFNIKQLSSTKTHMRGFARPLVSYDKAFVETGSVGSSMVGYYSFKTGVFVEDPSVINSNQFTCHYFKTSDSYDISGPRDIEIKKAIYSQNDHSFADSDGNGVFAYFASMYFPFTKTSENAGKIDISGFENNTGSSHKLNIAFDIATNRWLRAS